MYVQFVCVCVHVCVCVCQYIQQPLQLPKIVLTYGNKLQIGGRW